MENSMAYVAYCKCGKMIFAAVDNEMHKKDTAKEVSKMIRKGFSINRISSAQVRISEWCMNHDLCTG